MTMLTNPSHPGEVLSEIYLEPLNMGAPTLAKHLGVSRTRIERLIKGETDLRIDIAVRLAQFFGTTQDYWLNLQRNWELSQARETIDLSAIKPLEVT